MIFSKYSIFFQNFFILCLSGKNHSLLNFFHQTFDYHITIIISLLLEDTTFIKEVLKNKPSFAITTGHRKEYKKIMDDLKVKHQIVYILSPQDDWK